MFLEVDWLFWLCVNVWLNIFFWSYSRISTSHWIDPFKGINSLSFCSHLSLCFHPKSASRKIFPQQKRFFAFLPGQTVAVVLKLTLPPAQRSPNSCRVLSAPPVGPTDITYSWFSILCICSLIWLAGALLKSSFLEAPPSLSDVLGSSPSPDCPLLFLVRRLRVEGGVGTCREGVRMSHRWGGDQPGTFIHADVPGRSGSRLRSSSAGPRRRDGPWCRYACRCPCPPS